MPSLPVDVNTALATEMESLSPEGQRRRRALSISGGGIRSATFSLLENKLVRAAAV